MSNETPVRFTAIPVAVMENECNPIEFATDCVLAADYDKLERERDEARAALAADKKTMQAEVDLVMADYDRLRRENASLRAENERLTEITDGDYRRARGIFGKVSLNEPPEVTLRRSRDAD